MFDRIRTEVGDLFSDLRTAARALLVAVLGVCFAILMLRKHWDMSTSLVCAAIVIAYLIEWVGRSKLPRRPDEALPFLEWWQLAPAAISAFGSGLLIVVAVEWVPGDHADTERKELVGAVAAALTAFITSVMVQWASDKGDSRLAERIKRSFFACYKRAEVFPPPNDGNMYFVPSSLGEQLVYSNVLIEGWDADARKDRARRLAAEIAAGTSAPTSQTQINQALGLPP